jgi:hypothetical protein
MLDEGPEFWKPHLSSKNQKNLVVDNQKEYAEKNEGQMCKNI